MGAGALGSGLNSKLSLAAMEMDVAFGDDVAMFAETGDGSFTSITVTKLVGVSDRVGDTIVLVSSALISAFRKCDVNSSMH